MQFYYGLLQLFLLSRKDKNLDKQKAIGYMSSTCILSIHLLTGLIMEIIFLLRRQL